MIDVLLNICNKIWQTEEWPTPWTQSLIITLPKKGNLLQCQNYRTIKPYQSCEQGDVENLTKQVDASSRNDHSGGTSRV